MSLACASYGAEIGDSTDDTDPAIAATDVQPIAKGGGTRLSHGSKSPDVITNAGAQGIPYNNGPIMHGTTNVYIWYGSWGGQHRPDDPDRLHAALRWICVLQHQYIVLRYDR